MVTGALAVSYFGRPRTTMDLDLVIMTRPEEFEKLVGVLGRAGLKASKKKIASAWQSGYRIVTCLDKRSPYSLDIILPGGTITEGERFAPRNTSFLSKTWRSHTR
jgi:hypothetical protein